MDIHNLTNAERLGYLLGALADYADTPMPARKSDLTKALAEYQEAWINANGNRDVLGHTLNQEEVVQVLRGLRMAFIDKDPAMISALTHLRYRVDQHDRERDEVPIQDDDGVASIFGSEPDASA